MITIHDLQEDMTARGLSAYFEALAPLAKNAVHLTLDVVDEDLLPIGCSKFGGHPDLPGDVDWFRIDIAEVPMSFIAQINFAEVAPFDLEKKLPQQGMLYFFYDCSEDGMPWGFDPSDSDGWKVFYYDGSLDALCRKDAPEDLELDDNGVLFDAAKLCFEAVMELPSPDSDLTNDLALPDDEDIQDSYWEWLDDMESGMRNKLLGHADPVQGGMELECEYVTHRINCGTPDGYRIAKSQGLDKNASRWNLLLQVESNEDLGMMWGDLGRLYLWITDEDLTARQFENCWLVLQCG